jgi:NADH dehydrogenase
MDQLVTLFGGGGFLGRYVVQALCQAGVRIRIVQKNPRNAYFLKPLAELGQIQFVAVDIRDKDQVMAAVQGSSAVVNLVGILKGKFQKIHVEGARNISEAAMAAGAKSFAHVSAIGADPKSPSAYGRSKALGEEAVRAAFAQATIIRPSIVFGREDNFINKLATMTGLFPLLPVLSARTKFQPVYVADIAHAITAAALDPMRHGGNIYELGGPEVMSMRSIYERVGEATGRQPILINIPNIFGAVLALFTGWLPGAPITWAQWKMLRRDNVASKNSKSFDDFGISPAPFAAISQNWLIRYRRHGRFTARQTY